MQKPLTTAVFVLGLSAGFAPVSLGQPAPARRADDIIRSCQNLFGANKASIESMAQAGNTAGIRSLYVKAGCMAPDISIAKRSTEKAMPTIHCTGTIWPVNITCTWSSLAPKQVGGAVN